VYAGGYYVELFGDSSKCRGFKIVSGTIHNYHMDKLVTGNKHLIAYSGQGILFSSHTVEVWEYWCNLEYSIVLSGDSSKHRGFTICRVNLHNYQTDKLVTGNKHLITYWCHVSLSSSQFVQVWDYWCILEYYVELWGDSPKGRGFKIVIAVLQNYHTDKLVTGNKHLITYLGQGIYFPPILCRFENIGVI
jgi:hypothetical protein